MAISWSELSQQIRLTWNSPVEKARITTWKSTRPVDFTANMFEQHSELTVVTLSCQ